MNKLIPGDLPTPEGDFEVIFKIPGVSILIKVERVAQRCELSYSHTGDPWHSVKEWRQH